jgi:hypothetical protein
MNEARKKKRERERERVVMSRRLELAEAVNSGWEQLAKQNTTHRVSYWRKASSTDQLGRASQLRFQFDACRKAVTARLRPAARSKMMHALLRAANTQRLNPTSVLSRFGHLLHCVEKN